VSDKIKICMIQTIRPDLPFIPRPDEQGMILYEGKEYDAVTNSHGAISGICENGKQLGVRSKEFEFIKDPEWVLRAHGKYEMIRLQTELEKYKNEAEKIIGICQWVEDDIYGLKCISRSDCPTICMKYKPLPKAEE